MARAVYHHLTIPAGRGSNLSKKNALSTVRRSRFCLIYTACSEVDGAVTNADGAHNDRRANSTSRYADEILVQATRSRRSKCPHLELFTQRGSLLDFASHELTGSHNR